MNARKLLYLTRGHFLALTPVTKHVVCAGGLSAQNGIQGNNILGNAIDPKMLEIG